MQVRVVRISKAALVSWKLCRFQRQTAGPSDKVDVCLLPAGPFSGAALVGQGAQANSLRSSFFQFLSSNFGRLTFCSIHWLCSTVSTPCQFPDDGKLIF